MSGRDRFQQDTWYDVPVKKGKGNQHQSREKEKDLEVKFFVSNLPEECASSDLVRVFKEYGDVQGTYIARKYDRLGKRFGFVTFYRGRNMDDLESALKDVWIGSYKLFVAPARFVDGKEVPRKEEKVWQPARGKEVIHEGKDGGSEGPSVASVDINMEDRRSFKDTLLNKDPKPDDVIEIRVESPVAVFGEWYDRALVVHMKTLVDLTNMRGWLTSVCEEKVEIKYVGGLCVLLVFINRESKLSFTTKKDAWDVYVEMIEEWYGQTFMVPRIAWLKIRGIPLSLSFHDVFHEVASKFGVIIQPAIFPEEDGDLTVAVVGILRQQMERVNQRVRVLWKTSKFGVMVEEETTDWVPDCLVEMEEEGGLEVEESAPVNLIAEEVPDLNLIQDDAVVNSGMEGNDKVVDEIGEQVQKSPVIKKRKGFSRKKGSRNKSASPVGNDRPKKRQRDGEDFFDIDHFIFTVNEGQAALQKQVDSGSVHSGLQQHGLVSNENVVLGHSVYKENCVNVMDAVTKENCAINS
ncbi:putative RNA recognition motif domain, nucleotide-binding alpha-beta plait domain superfamily [Helianthus annuus]|uniref:RNA recognition motif domain, nucleotide-binding alpha-beta plait domain superfamily n=1 Tax=Helianthus annuus TaxID=4232 RepID=A0A9K3IF97_HELAN|nr:putative RNA recognition motif domain, nucleotide-binding alpha-beta plait domain superfamily [Helianthus annuus]KAJ0539331.1 putative RNA recognition motif domain, nucleotide-binding alpha-beta plait domain superfamily [Helianthus annuus]KAJ0547444.1 putative RNA recognition motif domain, nucleotide-binding alpha-beta plait domain superfamily [Helianthus annuus]KAJ0553994.1 putative RNA recognition motif domain, nucleotide-binding alpha-beta plait domain superfamily [Helianthus annuus]KAJ07